MDMSQYNELFLTEGREHLKKIATLAVELESDSSDRTFVDALFRSAHSVKGMAASMGFDNVARLAHRLEDLMDRVRGGVSVDATLFDLLLEGEAHLSRMFADIEAGGSGSLDFSDLEARVNAYPLSPEPGQPPQAVSELPKEPVSVEREEPDHLQTVKIKTAVLDGFVNSTGELITVKHRLAEISGRLKDSELSEAFHQLEKELRELHGKVMAVRLMPVSVVTDTFPRAVRDIARRSGKEITLSIRGAEIELDRSILDLIGSPLLHLLRNCVDHGIESPQQRTECGKSPGGRISVSFARERDQVEIRIEDDGRGVDVARVVKCAIEKGLVTREKASTLGEQEKLMLVCNPGFSTADTVTDISGRGVGMDVVKTAVQSMGGTLRIVTSSGTGTCFVLRLPLTVAIVNVLLVQVGRVTLALPLTFVKRTLELVREDIAGIQGVQSVLLDGEPREVVPLGRIMNIPHRQHGPLASLIIAEMNGAAMAIGVDSIIGNHEVFVRPLKRPLSALGGITGATILGSGEVVFITDISARSF